MKTSRSLWLSLLTLIMLGLASAQQAQAQQLFLSISPTTFSEGAGNNAATGSVTRSTSTTTALTVNLTSSNTSQAKVPSSITIPAGASFATFSITAVDNGLVNGPHTVTITAKATGFTSDSKDVTVTESDVPTLGLSLSPSRFSEGAGPNASTGTVTRNTATTAALTVNLSSSNTGAATVPASVTIPAGSTSANFPIGAVDDNIVTGSRTATITVTATGFTTASKNATVTDNDVATLTISINPTTFSEAAGPNAATGTVARNTDTSVPLSISFASSNPNKATVPFTVTIPTGATSATFPVGAVDNTIVDGTQTAIITGSVMGYKSNPVTLSITDNDVPSLTVSVNPNSFSEAAGANAATGTVTRNTDTTTALTVNLSSSNTSQATVPATVTIPAGAASATFPVAAVDNGVVTGPQTVTIAAAANGFTATPATVTVTDNNAPTLTLSVNPTTFSEAAGTNAATGTVSRNTDATAPLTVTLSSSNTNKARVPASVTIPAGATSTTFAVAAVDNTVVDGDQIVGLTASVSGFVPGRTRVTVTDNDVFTPTPTPGPTVTPTPPTNPTLTLSVNPSTFSEGAGVNAATGTISRNTSTDTAVVVTLSSSNTNQVRVPASVTIPVGATSVNFPLTAVNNNAANGDQVVGLTATAAGFVPGRTRVTVTDVGVTPTPTPGPTATPVPTPTPSNPTLTLTITPSTFSEGAGANAATGTITRNTSTSGALVVNLTSSNTNKVRVPSTVTIPAGATSVNFNLAAIDNKIVDGSVVVGITATVSGFAAGRARVTVTDNDTTTPTPTPGPTATPVPTPTPLPTPALGLSIAPITFSEGAGANAATGTVSRNTSTLGALTVSLFSSNTAQVRVPPTVVIPAGAVAANFPVTAVDDKIVDGPQVVGITAIVSGLVPGRARVTVTNVDVAPTPVPTPQATPTPTPTPAPNATLSLTVTPATFSEAAGPNAATGTVTRSIVTNSVLRLNLFSSNTNKVRVPTTLTIPAGAASASFAVAAIFNPASEPTQTADITAIASGFLPAVAQVTVTNSLGAAASVGQSSNASLSTAVVNAVSDSVELSFPAALEAGAASDAIHYSVTVNGQNVSVESAGYNASKHSVTLSLADGSLRAGDVVTVRWNGLQDVKGNPVAGQLGSLVAK